jgi:GT2 family glycosyltransferase
LIVIVAQPEPLDSHQQAAAERITADPRARVIHLPVAAFNFSHVNNQALDITSGQHLCFVNDDVSPIGPDWLDLMTAHLHDPKVGVVGARLQYPDGSLQHAGIIMGLGGLVAAHAHRHVPSGASGYAWRATLTQEFSAVTGACMLVRRTVFEAAGGFDETYPSAHNDIDFCLRVRDAGNVIVLAAEATLIHHESLTYENHYAGRRTGEERDEIARMRRRWAAFIAADPFYSPNLDLAPGREWCLAFPPRPVVDVLGPDQPRQ